MADKRVAPVIVSIPVPERDRVSHAIYFDDPSLTVQSFKDETDINLIVARAIAGGDVLHVNPRVARYGDFSNVPDYQAALNLVNRAEGMFRELPANVRERFSNDPVKMVEFLQHSENYDEAVKLGLVVARPIPDVPGGPSVPPVVPPVPPVPPVGASRLTPAETIKFAHTHDDKAGPSSGPADRR